MQGAPCLAHRIQKGHIYPADERKGLLILPQYEHRENTKKRQVVCGSYYTTCTCRTNNKRSHSSTKWMMFCQRTEIVLKYKCYERHLKEPSSPQIFPPAGSQSVAVL